MDDALRLYPDDFALALEVQIPNWWLGLLWSTTAWHGVAFQKDGCFFIMWHCRHTLIHFVGGSCRLPIVMSDEGDA
jgi:hypothetical protein